ncbi:MAG TPA: STAS domain-containing protein [Nitrospirota bacterium]
MSRNLKDFRELNECVVIYTDNYLNDIEGEKLEDKCDLFLKRGMRKIVIDFTNTELVNSIGISILVGIMEKIRNKRGILFFSNLRKVNHDIFNMLGLTKHVPIFPTEEEAIRVITTNDQ